MQYTRNNSFELSLGGKVQNTTWWLKADKFSIFIHSFLFSFLSTFLLFTWYFYILALFYMFHIYCVTLMEWIETHIYDIYFNLVLYDHIVWCENCLNLTPYFPQLGIVTSEQYLVLSVIKVMIFVLIGDLEALMRKMNIRMNTLDLAYMIRHIVIKTLILNKWK